jgi:hypothetical protein
VQKARRSVPPQKQYGSVEAWTVNSVNPPRNQLRGISTNCVCVCVLSGSDLEA